MVIRGTGSNALPVTSDNPIVRAACRIFEQVRRIPARLEVHLLNRIPLASGMGTSAAATIGGMAAANELTGRQVSRRDILRMAVEMEGHPDNVAPALYGGLTIYIADDKNNIHIHSPSVRVART